jgi:hypothetical protein
MRLNLSESARVTSAQESRYRIDYPNSRPRVSRIIALDERSMQALATLKDYPWNGARFLRFLRPLAGSATLPNLPVDAVLQDAGANEAKLGEEIAAADVIVMVTTAGSAPDAAEIIGNACLVRGKRASGLVLAGDGGEDLTRTLKALRPYAAMLVVSSGEDYIAEMLAALRA